VDKIRRLLIIFCLLMITTACSLVGEEEEAAVTPLDRSAWPTPAPTEAKPTPTPFPQVEAAVIEAQQASEIARLAASTRGVEEAASQVEPIPQGDVPAATPTTPPPTPIPQGDVPAAAPTPEATAPPAVMGAVSSFALNLRAAPGLTTDVLRRLKQGDVVTVLATDPDSGWVNVQTGDGATGWVNPKYLNLTGQARLVQSQRLNQSNSSRPEALAGDVTQSDQPVGQARLVQSQRLNQSRGWLLIQLKSGAEIMAINRDGSGLRYLTAGIDPVLSPDGAKVAFTRWGGTDPGSLWVINADGTGERAVLGNIKQVKSPAWSPDGKQIAVNFQEGGALTPTRRCYDLIDGEPDINFWIAYDIDLEYVNIDGQQIPIKICWTLPPDPNWRLRIIDLEARSYEDLPAGQYAFAPTWDPVNAWRVVSTDRPGLVWTDILRGVSAALTNDPADRGPVFSPDGKYIAVTYRQADHWEIHRLNADGTGRARLTKTPLYAVAAGSPGGEGVRQANNVSPAFSPDGSEIAFLTDRSGRWEVWVMNLDGSDQRPMFPAEVNEQLQIVYEGNDARMLGWGE